MSTELAGRRALVTGASGGIGEATGDLDAFDIEREDG